MSRLEDSYMQRRMDLESAVNTLNEVGNQLGYDEDTIANDICDVVFDATKINLVMEDGIVM